MNFKLICTIVGVICLFLVGLSVPGGRAAWGWLGLAFLALAQFLL